MDSSNPVTEERDYWRQIVSFLHTHYTLATIADQINVSERQVSNIEKLGQRPTGMTAIKLIQFYAKTEEHFRNRNSTSLLMR